VRTLAGHLGILRFDHWIKNVLVLPGAAVALTAAPETAPLELGGRLCLALLATGLVASGNYALNELLDAEQDGRHPQKRHRPVPSGRVDRRIAWAQWPVLSALGIALAALLSTSLAFVLALMAAVGLLYNVPPARAKDVLYVDVLWEALNSPLRMLVGWYAVAPPVDPIPVSLLISYWMAGAYFMAVKRLAELRQLQGGAATYRPVLAAYTEPRLLVSIVFYAAAAMLFLGAFVMRYRMELVLAFPFVAWSMAAYLALAFAPDSAAQAPERLYREPRLVLALVLCAALMTVLLFVDVPLLYEVFRPTLPLPQTR
jgi:4-hydroxybenzoate polyprenyltransferase